MPEQEIGDEELEQEVMSAEQQAAQEQQASIAQAAPPASEPLTPERVNVLGETLITTMEALTGGQVSEMPEQIEQDVDQVPDRMFTQLAAISEVFNQIPGGEPYAFDPAQVASDNEGLAEAIEKIGQAGRDKNFARAVASAAGGQGEEPEAAPPEAPPEEDVSEYV